MGNARYLVEPGTSSSFNMEPLSVCIDEVPRMVGGADGEAGKTRRPAQEFEVVGIGAASARDLSAVLGKDLADSGGGLFVIGHQAAQIIVEVFYLFPV